MSLVHEALRKAEREKQRKAGTVPNVPPAPHQPAPTPPAQIHTPVVHEPVAVTPVAPPIQGAHPHPQPPSPEPSRETNHYLLSALIGCVAIVAIIAIVFLVSNASSLLHQTKEALPATAASTPPAPVAQSTPPPDPAATTPSVVQPASDSAAPPAVPPSTPPTLDDSRYKISGIMKDPDGKPVAVINGHVAYEGYYVDGAIVEKIETDRVTIDIHGQKAVLRLF